MIVFPGGQGDVHHQSKPSTSFMNQSLNVSVIQGINQTYANIVAPDSDSSSLNATPDIKKARKRHTKNKRKLEVASLPADMIPKPPPKKIKSSAVPPTDTSTASISKEVVSGGKDSNTTYIMGEETQHDKQQTQTKGSSTEVASVKAGTKKTLHALTLSPNISSISALSAESDGTYDFTMEDDDTFSNIIETKQKLSKQVASRKLNLPSVIEALQKTKTTESKIAANVETSVAPSVQASTSATSPQASHEAVKERSKLNKTYQDTDYDFIPPPQSFRDDEIATAETMHEADGSNDGGKNDDVEPINQEGFDVPQEEDKGGVVHQDASTGQRESVDQATATTFITTPTRSAQRKSVGQASTITTPTRSSSRKSVGQVSVATSTSPIRSAQRRSVGRVSVGTSITPNMSAGGEIIATPARSSQGKSVGGEVIATPTKSSQRKSVGGEVIVPPTRSSQRKSVGGEVITTPTRSSQRNSMGGEVNATPTKSSQRKSVGGEVIATPTRSSQRKSAGEVIATPTKSSQRKSVGSEVIATPTGSSQRKSVGSEVIATIITTTPPTATPINLTPKVDVGRNTESMLMSPQTGDGMKDTSATGSTVRSKMSQASNAEQQGTSAITSMPSPAENKDVAAVSPQREQDTHDVQESGEAAQGGSSDHESDDIVLPLSNEDESPNKKKRIGNDLPEDVAEEPLPEDAIEEAPLTDREDEISYSPVSAKQSSQASNRNVSTSSIVDVQKGETSLSKSNAVPKPKEQSLPSTSTGRVRQMTMREYLVQLKTKPMPPPFAKPKPLLANVFGTTTRTKSPSKAPQRQKQKRSKKLTDLPTTFSRSITKELFTHFAKCRVTSAAVDEVVRSSEMFWQNLTRDMSAITSARKETQHIEARDIEKLMKRQGVITSKQSLNALVEELLPTEMWKLFMPFPNAAKNPFQPFTGPLFNPEKATGLEEDESEGELDG